MPYKIVPLKSGKYKMVNKKTGEVHAKKTTKKKTVKQMQLLQMKEHGIVPEGGWRK